MSLGDTQFCLYVPATAAKKCCSSIPIYTPRSPDHRNTSQFSSQRVTSASHYKTATLKLFPTRLEQNFPVLWYQKKRVTSTSSGSQETDQMKKKEKKKERRRVIMRCRQKNKRDKWMWGKYAIAPALTLRNRSRSCDTLLLWTTVRDAPWNQDTIAALCVAGITTQARRFTTGVLHRSTTLRRGRNMLA